MSAAARVRAVDGVRGCLVVVVVACARGGRPEPEDAGDSGSFVVTVEGERDFAAGGFHDTARTVAKRMGLLPRLRAAHVDSKRITFVDPVGRTIGSLRPEQMTGGKTSFTWRFGVAIWLTPFRSRCATGSSSSPRTPTLCWTTTGTRSM
ncbi:hypothetical protein ACFC5Z_14690 [Streptomyces sp. NPDC056004]|uniref:hypothetical protein n=1 Tax=unclassified Streptomyces TaxID=2593676 RepID=UPI0035D60676